jgi:hypothetical protein
VWQYGSGGGNNYSIGGGRLSLVARSFLIYGNIYAGGTPSAYSQSNGKFSKGLNFIYSWWLWRIHIHETDHRLSASGLKSNLWADHNSGQDLGRWRERH